MREKVRQILGIAVLNGKFIQRQPLWIFQGFIMACGFAVTLFFWGGSAALRNLVIAYFITGGWGLGLNTVAQIIGWNRVQLLYDFYVASPVTLPMYFVGTILGSMPLFVTSVIPAIIIAIILEMDFSFIIPIILLAATSAVIGQFTSLSVILRLKKPTNISAITNPLYVFTTILPPVYYPLTFISPILRPFILIVPTASLMELSRWFAGVPIATNVVFPLISTISWLILTTILVAKKLRWGLE